MMVINYVGIAFLLLICYNPIHNQEVTYVIHCLSRNKNCCLPLKRYRRFTREGNYQGDQGSE